MCSSRKGKKWHFLDSDSPKISCFSCSPKKMLLGIQETITWRYFGRVLWQMTAIAQDVGGKRWIHFLFQQNGVPQDITIGMEPETIAGGKNIRFWFVCPGCLKRCKVLFLIPGTDKMLCRGCGKVGYCSRQHEHPKRLMEKMGAFVKKFDTDGSTA